VAVTSLIRSDGLLVIRAAIWGRVGRGTRVHLALDTAATETLIRPAVLERVGYGAADAERVTTIHSAVGKERGYLLRIARRWALGFEVREETVHAHELPGLYDIDGLLGLRFLDLFDYTIRSIRDEIDVQLASS